MSDQLLTRLTRCAATLAMCAGASAAIAPVTEAHTRAYRGSTPFEWPFVVGQEPDRPMCIGVQTTTWGDGKGNYTGPCRFGAPLGPMTAAIKQMNRRHAMATAKEYGFSQRNAPRLQSEFDTIARLPFTTALPRLKRHAASETRAAKGTGDAKPSWLKRAAVNCAIWGAVAGTVENVTKAWFEGKGPDASTAKAMGAGCAMAVISPPLARWVKSKGYDLEA